MLSENVYILYVSGIHVHMSHCDMEVLVLLADSGSQEFFLTCFNEAAARSPDLHVCLLRICMKKLCCVDLVMDLTLIQYTSVTWTAALIKWHALISSGNVSNIEECFSGVDQSHTSYTHTQCHLVDVWAVVTAASAVLC